MSDHKDNNSRTIASVSEFVIDETNHRCFRPTNRVNQPVAAEVHIRVDAVPGFSNDPVFSEWLSWYQYIEIALCLSATLSYYGIEEVQDLKFMGFVTHDLTEVNKPWFAAFSLIILKERDK